VFADIDPATLNLDPAAVETAITERTRAIVAVDIFGYPCELDQLRELCDRHGLVLIEDACEALGAEYKGRPLGSHGHLTVLADDADHKRSWFVYPLRLDPAIDRARLAAELARRGIATKVYLPSIHLQPYMRERFGFREGMCPVSEEASRRLLSLPFYSALEPEDQERVVEALRAAL